MNRRSEAPRAARGGVFAVVAVWLAAMAHVSAGGDLPDPAVMVVAGGVLGFAAAGLAQRVRRLPEIAGALLGAQVLLHVLFAVAGHHDGPVLPHGTMLVAHLGAALISAVALAGAEAAAAWIRGARARLLGVLAPRLPAIERGWSVHAGPSLDLLGARDPVHDSPRRGPPLAG